MATNMARTASTLQYAAEEYRRALELLASDRQTVADRREALVMRDDFERRVRNGSLAVAQVAAYAATVAYAAKGEACADPETCQPGGPMCLRCVAIVCEAHLEAMAEERAAALESLNAARGEQP